MKKKSFKEILDESYRPSPKEIEFLHAARNDLQSFLDKISEIGMKLGLPEESAFSFLATILRSQAVIIEQDLGFSKKQMVEAHTKAIINIVELDGREEEFEKAAAKKLFQS